MKSCSYPGSGLRGAVGIFLASIPLLVGLPNAQLYFDIGFVVVLVSLAAQGWSIASAARRLHIALPHHDPPPRRVELDLAGQLAQELVGYSIGHDNPYLRRHLMPSWAKPMLVVRDEEVLSSEEAGRGARGRPSLSAGAARKGTGARSLFRRHAAAGCARPAAPRRLFRSGRRDAWGARGNLRARHSVAIRRTPRSPTISPGKSVIAPIPAILFRSVRLRSSPIRSTRAM